MRFSTPLRYPGGKGKLTGYLKKTLEINELHGCHYVEPYAGGAGVAINLLMSGHAGHIHLNDLNGCVFAFWKSVIDHTEDLCRLINDTTVCMEEWNKNKKIISTPEKHNNLDLGFATFFLNRTNRSGILLGGVIGGKHQSGNWKIDARFNKIDLISRIERIADRKSNISLYNLDAKYFLVQAKNDLPDSTFLYLDPPYYVKGKGLYQNHYSHNDHLDIAHLIKKNDKHLWMVSYDNTPEINEMYQGLRKIEYGINYSAQDRYQGPEIIFFSEKLKVYDTENPIKIKN
ncbi:DNA adenine methylase [Buttiauxella gaviniae]|uniref:DNA adenine methylase n=1 Tax=Buttiauxella gaviniae TaxID=82990 RepID=UPI0039AEE713